MFELIILVGFIYIIMDKLYVKYGWKSVDFIAAMCIPFEIILFLGIIFSFILTEFEYLSLFL